MKYNFSIFLLFILPCFSLIYGQKLSGIVKDDATKEPIEGATVLIKGTNLGAYTDVNGKFEITYTGTLPCTVVVTYVGLKKQEIEVKNLNKPFTINMLPDEEISQPEIEIVDTRITEKQKESPLTIESMDIVAIKETPAANFYDGLGNLKGVDVTASSMGFKIINTRGFNTTRPVRSLQLVDGMDNQAPGLNFSLGNFVGASELDVQSVDLVVGASSAIYGPNAFNGVIDMKLKSPFYHEGLSVMLKGGERYLFDGAVRYAKAFKNKNDEQKFAFKINLAYMRADDWRATNYMPTEQSLNPEGDIRGYDAVNIYGDERAFGDNTIRSRRLRTGLGRVYRTGYREEDLLNYDVKSFKGSIGLHYKFTKDIELSTLTNYGTGNTIFQGDNRYALRNLQFLQNKIEIKGKKWFIRAYATNENAGNSYDAVFTALLLQRKMKPDDRWYADYDGYWSQTVMPKIRAIPGYMDAYNQTFAIGNPSTNPNFHQQMDSLLRLMEGLIPQDSLKNWHQEARAYADGPGNPFFGLKSRLEPGTQAFKDSLQKIIQGTNFNDGGSKLVDRSALYHVQGEYKFTSKFMDIILGASYRIYVPRSEGSIFSDTLIDPNRPELGRVNLSIYEAGAYTLLEKKILADRLKINASARVDKSKNYNAVFSPAASLVYTVQKKHNYRLSFSSALRNPTLQDQYLYYNFGRALLVGNIKGVDTLISVESLLKFLEANDYSVRDTVRLAPVRPERVRSIEIGYKGAVTNNLFIDASAYVSWYRDFLGFRFLGQYDPSETKAVPLKIYRFSANADEMVRSQGFSLGFNYFFKKYYAFSGNYSYNELNKLGATDPIIPAFNTPKHKFNIGFGFRDLVADIKLGEKTLKIRNLGFNTNLKWQQEFFYEGSPQFTGTVPSFTWLDAQINYRVPSWKTTFKLGASNLLNQKRFLAYGSPYIGRMGYFQALLEL
jgi:outer membrane receptor protein involved in Fe transport